MSERIKVTLLLIGLLAVLGLVGTGEYEDAARAEVMDAAIRSAARAQWCAPVPGETAVQEWRGEALRCRIYARDGRLVAALDAPAMAHPLGDR